MANKTAVVSGSNKGIGLAIVKGLLKRGIGTVYLTARDVAKGKKAVDQLKKEGLNPAFHQLEVTNKESVKKFAYFLKKEHGGIDILINNAAVITGDALKTTFPDSKQVLETNYYGVLLVQEFFFPILKNNARVINISSDCGHISNLKNKYWIERLTKPDLEVADVNAFVQWFLDNVKNGTLKEEDFNDLTALAYRVSKIALSAITRVQQKSVDKNISVNSLHPGFVQTDMTKGYGQMTVDEVWEVPVYLALDVDQSIKGRYFWFDKSEKDWADPNQELYENKIELMKYIKEIKFWEKLSC